MFGAQQRNFAVNPTACQVLASLVIIAKLSYWINKPFLAAVMEALDHFKQKGYVQALKTDFIHSGYQDLVYILYKVVGIEKHAIMAALLAALHESSTAHGDSMVNTQTLNLMGKLLHISDYSVHASELSTSNVELLLEFILHALCNNKLSRSHIQKARRLMFELVSKMNIIPKSLFITNVKTAKAMIAVGGFGRVFQGVYKKFPVALKVVDKGHTNDSLRKDFCREALAWRSLSHKFILPLLGIFEKRSQLFLVSPFMDNGTLTDWRKEQGLDKISEIHRLMLEVAEGMKYLHSEGIVHGDLHGRNVLLDANFHCQITDFGSTRHSEAAVTQTTTALTINFVAPELFGMCTICGLPSCGGCQAGQKIHKTMATDVYAFGCLYYATFFDTAPFHDKHSLQIFQLVTNGKRPARLESPRMEDDTWHLIERCWKQIPSRRLMIKDIETALVSRA
ncbi:hypothetical protein AX14_005990 [Amanita brunnescens Koide BX004]|nr:hypothetical protein AX14_005990 [Amanita brunnescens Koide BX004]